MSTEERYEMLDNDKNHAEYMPGLEEWEGQRKSGHRRARSTSKRDVAAVSESGLETKQLVGYLWPLHILKEHGKPVPRRLQTVPHLGKQVKGAILKEWTFGCIEVSTNSSKKARQTVSVADDDNEDGPDASMAFSSLEKSVNISVAASATEGHDIVLGKAKMKGGTESDDDLASIMWGDSNIGGPLN
eukprot:s745_g12.t1